MSVPQLSEYCPLLPLIVFLIFCLKKSKTELKVIFFYILIAFVFDLFTTDVAYGIKNIWKLMPIFTIVEYLLFSGFVWLSLTNAILKKVIVFISLLFVVFALVNYVHANKTDFYSIPSSVENILVITYCIMYMFEQISKPQISFIYSSPNFWVVLGLFIYTSSTLFLFITTSSLSGDEQNKYWIINNISNIISNILFSIAFIANSYKPKNPDPFDDYLNMTL